MEELIPEYNENIIVGVIYNNIFDWYVTDKEIWFLDYKKRINAFKEKGVPVKEEYIDENRKNILILNTENAKFFLNRIKKYKISSRKLRVLLQQSINSNDDSWFYDFRPSLYVNMEY